ncbi:MAG: CapA family protein, partial [bacterium]|nr:CapA family protein [bacterium]
MEPSQDKTQEVGGQKSFQSSGHGQQDFQSPQVAEAVTRSSKLNKKRLLISAGGILLLAAALAYFVYSSVDSAKPPNQQVNTVTEEPVEQKTSLRMLATGDWIAHDSINAQAKTDSDSGYDYAQFLTAFKPYFDESDINFCNQATPTGGEEFGISGYPVFNAPLQWSTDMFDFGCNVINTGTNHTNDKGQAVITEQLTHWDSYETLAVAGANRSAEEQKKVRYFEMDGIKFAFLSYSTYSNLPNPKPYSLNRYDPKLYQPQMKEARAQADIVIVSMRWGTEYADAINSAQEDAAQKLADLGADIVLGHGTHTLQ